MRDENPVRRISPHSAEGRRRAGAEEESISFSSWDPHQPYPASSMPALRAAKCARLQGEEVFQRFHLALFRAFFEDCQNIADREVLLSLAKNAGLDLGKFSSDFDASSQEKEILAEYEDYKDKYEGWGVPLVIVGERYPVVGAAPIAMYRRAIDLCLAAQTD